MKKSFILLTLLFLGIKSQAQNNICPNAIPISDLNGCFLADVKDTVSWFSFTASQAQQQVLISNHIAGTSPTSGDLTIFLQSLSIYSGACNSLQLIESKNISSGSAIINRNDFVSSNVYYIKVSHQFINGNHFDLCFHQKSSSVESIPSCELICNGDFEDSSGCVYLISQMNYTKCWDKIAFNGDTNDIQDLYTLWNFRGSPDYFNSNYGPSCNQTLQCPGMPVDVPQNGFNTTPVPSYSGPNAYVGIISYRSDAVTTSPNCTLPIPYNYREYIQQELHKRMQAGRKYRIRFAYRLSDSSDYAVKLGILFSNDTIEQNNGDVYLHKIPQLTTNFLTVNNQWATVDFIYTVPNNTSYSWVAIGNFKTDTDPLGLLYAHPGKLYHTDFNCNMCNTSQYNDAYYFLDSVSIKPIDTLTVLPITQCHVTNFNDTIIASLPNDSGATFSWTSNPMDTTLSSPNEIHNDTIIVRPTVTTVYTVLVTDIYGCTYLKTAKINIPPPDSIVGGNNICINDTLLYTVNNCVTIPNVVYSWSVSNGNVVAQSLNGCQITIDWTPAQSALGGTIICVATDTITGCTNADTILVKKCCTQPNPSCLNNNPNLFNTSVTATNANCPLFEPYLPLQHSYKITGRSFSINGTFTIDSNLILNGCQIVLGPDAKIIIPHGRKLQITRQGTPLPSHLYGCDPLWDGIFIQDSTAKVVINTDSWIEDADSAVVSINGGRFNIFGSIFNKNYKHIVVQPYAGITKDTVLKTVFTCRSIPFSPAPSEVGVAADLKANAFTNTGNLYPRTTLMHPDTAFRTAIGIEIDHNTHANNVPLRIGFQLANQENVFDYMDVGIKALASNVLILNSYFIKIGAGFTSPTGRWGVWSIGEVPPPNAHLPIFTTRIGGPLPNQLCYFENCYTGIRGETDATLLVHNNIFLRMQIYGVEVQTANNNNVLKVWNNTFKDFRIGVHTILNSSLQATILGNSFNGQTRSGAFGVQIQEFAPFGLSYIVSANRMDSVSRGIVVQNIKNLGIANNSIRVKRATLSPSAVGIGISNCSGATVISNKIGPPISINYTPFTVTGGISASLSSATLFQCNESDSLGFGLRCAGNMPCKIYDNTFNVYTYGFWLSNGGFVGQQPVGSPLQPSYNQWFNPNPSALRCNSTQSSNGIGSQFIYRNGNIAFVPLPSGSTDVSGSIVSSVGTNNGSLSPPPCSPGNGAGGNLLDLSHSIIQNQIVFHGNDSASSVWLGKQALYNYIVADTIDVSNDTMVTHFVNSTSNLNIGKITQVNAVLMSPDSVAIPQLNYALALNNSIHSHNQIEANHKLVNRIYIQYRLHHQFSQQAKDDLHYLALLCPFSDGTAVYQARAILGLIDPPGTEYVSECEMDEDNSNGRIADHQADNKQALINVFPNPANSELNIMYNISSTQALNFTLFNTLGEKVLTQKLSGGENTVKISVSGINEGLYIYKISSGDEPIKNGKIIIEK